MFMSIQSNTVHPAAPKRQQQPIASPLFWIFTGAGINGKPLIDYLQHLYGSDQVESKVLEDTFIEFCNNQQAGGVVIVISHGLMTVSDNQVVYFQDEALGDAVNTLAKDHKFDVWVVMCAAGNIDTAAAGALEYSATDLSDYHRRVPRSFGRGGELVSVDWVVELLDNYQRRTLPRDWWKQPWATLEPARPARQVSFDDPGRLMPWLCSFGEVFHFGVLVAYYPRVPGLTIPTSWEGLHGTLQHTRHSDGTGVRPTTRVRGLLKGGALEDTLRLPDGTRVEQIPSSIKFIQRANSWFDDIRAQCKSTTVEAPTAARTAPASINKVLRSCFTWVYHGKLFKIGAWEGIINDGYHPYVAEVLMGKPPVSWAGTPGNMAFVCRKPHESDTRPSLEDQAGYLQAILKNGQHKVFLFDAVDEMKLIPSVKLLLSTSGVTECHHDTSQSFHLQLQQIHDMLEGNKIDCAFGVMGVFLDILNVLGVSPAKTVRIGGTDHHRARTNQLLSGVWSQRELEQQTWCDPGHLNFSVGASQPSPAP